MKKKLIIFIPHINIGGVEKNLFLITNYLIKKINNISIITINKEFTKKLNKKIEIISPKTNRWKNSSMYTKYAISIFLLIKIIFKNKNSLIFSFQANWYAIIIAKIFRIKIVTRSNTAPQGWSNNFFKKMLYKFIINFADEIIVNSFEFKKSLKKYFNIQSNCIYNPLNKSKILKLSLKKIKYPFFKTKKHIKIINIGRFTDQKNQILILKAVNQIKDSIPLRVLIIGTGRNYENLKNFIKKNNLQNYVDLKKNIDNPFPYLKLADIFLLSSNYEGLPNVLLEAQTFKKMIISTRCPTGPKEILLNGKAGVFFKMNDAKDLSKKIIFSYKNQTLLKKMALIGYNNLNRFNEIKNLNNYLKVILKFI